MNWPWRLPGAPRRSVRPASLRWCPSAIAGRLAPSRPPSMRAIATRGNSIRRKASASSASFYKFERRDWMKIGFIGLGNMGTGIAANLQRAGHEMAVWNRSPQKARSLVDQGAVLASSPGAAASGREIVLTMLADDAALEQ